ncbi:MAG: hypothetical protein LUE89_10570 [Clostridiales bacterium]|nr:hypothetical protein [Clostridiales bacterium]
MAGRKWGVNAHTDEFHRTASGEYVYTGGHYAYQGGGRSRRRAMAGLVALWAASFAATVAAGCIPGTGMQQRAYVILPYVVQMVASVSLGWGIGRLVTGGDPLRAYVYEETVGSIPRRALVAAVGAALTILGELLDVFLAGGGEELLPVLGLLCLEILAFLGIFSVRRALSKMRWEKIGGN